MNAVRLRKLLSTLEGEDYPGRPARAPIGSFARPRSAARSRCPTSTSTSDIGGYAKVKERLRAEILDVLARKDQLTDAEADRAVWRS